MGPDLLSFFTCICVGQCGQETSEDAAPEVVLLKTSSRCLTNMLLMAQEEPCAVLGVVSPRNGEDC